MQPTDQYILDAFASRVRVRYPTARIWALDAGVRGDAIQEEDFGVCVEVDQMVTSAMKDWIGDIAWDVGLAADRIIMAVVFER